MQFDTATLQNRLVISYKAKQSYHMIEQLHSGIFPNEMKTPVHINTCRSITAALFRMAKYEATKMSFDSCGNPYNVILFINKKKWSTKP